MPADPLVTVLALASLGRPLTTAQKAVLIQACADRVPTEDVMAEADRLERERAPKSAPLESWHGMRPW